jgi:hypothetical protein
MVPKPPSDPDRSRNVHHRGGPLRKAPTPEGTDAPFSIYDHFWQCLNGWRPIDRSLEDHAMRPAGRARSRAGMAEGSVLLAAGTAGEAEQRGPSRGVRDPGMPPTAPTAPSRRPDRMEE